MDGGPPGKDVLHVDGGRAADGNISGRYAEAEPFGTLGMSIKDGRIRNRRTFHPLFSLSLRIRSCKWDPAATVPPVLMWTAEEELEVSVLKLETPDGCSPEFVEHL